VPSSASRTFQAGEGSVIRDSTGLRPPSTLRDQTRPTVPLQTHRLRTGGVTLTILTFDASTHHLAVVDNEGGPGTGATSSQAAARSNHAIAGINGGFFTPEGKALGLVIEDRSEFGALNSSSLGAGLYVHDPRAGATRLVRRGAWSRSGTETHLLQSGPLLVENHALVPGLSNTRPRPRSFLLWDGHQGWAMGHASSITLAALGVTLASQPVPAFTIKSALNLDGGTSSDLWVAATVKGGPASTRRLWSKPARNYLVLQRSRR
jgi:hypothetical protein